MAARVSSPGEIPPRAGSVLALETVRLAPGERRAAGDPGCDVLLFAFGGGGELGEDALSPGSAALLLAGEEAELAAGREGLLAVRVAVGAATDLHAPLGERERIVAVDEVEPGRATGSRSFQVLFGPHNGSSRATMFVGYVPPGRSPWHYHLYDEVVWIWRGGGCYHLAAGADELAEGAAFRVLPREVHIVENRSGERELAVLGVFTPAGSPAAAYLAPGVAGRDGTSAA